MSSIAVERSYRGVSGADRAAERRAQLLDAGLTLAGEHGVAAVAMRAVCREAGLSPRYFYESFADVDELLRAVFDAALERMQGAVGAALGESLHAAFVAATELIEHDPRVGRVLFREPLAGAVLREHAAAHIPGFFSAAIGGLDDTLRLTAVSGALIHLFLARADGVDATTVEEFADYCTDVVDRLVG